MQRSKPRKVPLLSIRPHRPPSCCAIAFTLSLAVYSLPTFGYQPGPTYGRRLRQDCLVLQQPSTKSGSAPSTDSMPSAGQRMGGRGRWPARCACSASTPCKVPLARAGRHSALQALPRCGSRRTAPAKFARCPQSRHDVADRAHLPSFCLSAAPGTSRFAFSSFRKISCASPASRWPR